ncbi:flagellin [Vibrio sp. SM6]|uniref:Flagellin n=1 Tax=Vibrio agarilyticus TaxID=2726741 RepID=A0A7X8TRZ7_9VIBR|nr:flagellin [Vibrio agarilyticus]NLS13725.1 flagellin [Vibrio agarilyticus]
MVMSTVEVRAQGLRLASHEQTAIAPSRSSNSSPIVALKPRAQHADTMSAYSVTTMRLAQGQQHATSVQIAAQSLQQVGKELSKMKSQLSQALSVGVAQMPQLKEQLGKGKQTIEQTLQQARYEGKRVVDNELRVKLDTADIRRFAVPGLNIHRLSERAEQIRLDFPQGQSVMIQFDGQSDGMKTLKMLDRSLIPMGMRASLGEDGAILFEAQESAYRQMQQKVQVTGQGHRFPAGQPNTLLLKPDPEGIAELNFDLSHRDGIKQSIGKLNKHLQQVHTSLYDARQFQQSLNQEMTGLASSRLTPDSVNQQLEQWQTNSEQFSFAFRALNAQANVKRHSVVALLK